MTKTVINPQQVFSDTVIPLWLGAGEGAGNAILGGFGATLKGLGGYFEPTEEQLAQQRELYRNTARFLGLPEGWESYSPPQPNALSRAGNYLLGLNSQVQNNVNQAREDLLGERQGLYTNAMEGVGATLIPFLLDQAGPVGKVAKAFYEAGAEAGDVATNGGKGTLESFLANLVLNAGLELLPEGRELLGETREWTPAQKVTADFGKELLEQGALQNPAQRMIRTRINEEITGR